MRQLHYSWVGNACTTDIAIPQNDLIGPVALEQVIDHTKHHINFWCFEQQKAKYQKLLDDKKIRVVSFEECLKECLDNPTLVQRALGVLQLQQLLFTSSRSSSTRAHTIRDYVTFKEAMSLFLLYAYGGYAMDTNVVPHGDNIVFPDPVGFHMMGLSYPVKKCRDVDVGVMSASLKDREYTGNALDIFLNRVNQLEKERALLIQEHGHLQEIDFNQYKAFVLDVIIEAAWHGNNKPAALNPLSFFSSKHLGGNFPVLLRELNIIKHYTNSHGAGDRVIIPELHLAVSRGEIEKVEEILKRPDAPHVDALFATEKYGNITAYSVACFYHYEAIAELLLRYNACPLIPLKPLIEMPPCSPVHAGFFALSMPTGVDGVVPEAAKIP